MRIFVAVASILGLAACVIAAGLFYQISIGVLPGLLVAASMCVFGLFWSSGYIEAWLKPYLKNDGLAGALATSVRLFARAERDVKILTGDLRHEFYSSPRIIESLSAVARAGIPIEILSGPTPDSGNERFFSFVEHFRDVVSFDRLPYRPKEHFMVVDGRHFRIELKHPDESWEEMEGRVSFDNPLAAAKLVHAFEFLQRKMREKKARERDQAA